MTFLKLHFRTRNKKPSVRLTLTMSETAATPSSNNNHPSHELLSHALATKQFSGAVHLVVDATEGIRHCWQGGVAGVRVPTQHHPSSVDVDTLFMINSTTKVLTAVAVLQLVEKKLVSLDASVQDYVPLARSYGEDLTVRHLLNYSGGVPNPVPTRWFHLASEDFSESEALAKAVEENPDLKFEAGTKFLYSNLGYWLLGSVIEAVSGQALEIYFAENIRKPLNIAPDDLSFSVDEGNVQKLARGHQRKAQLLTLVLWLMTDKKIWDQPEAGWSCFQKPLYHDGKAYGGLFATAGALSVFLQDMLRPDPVLLSAETRDLMFTKQTSTDGTTELGTTLGWMHGTADDGVFFLSKPGGGPGFFSNIRLYPEQGFGTILLANETQVSEAPIQTLSDTVDGPLLKARRDA